ncbi:MAG: FAD-dependent oxidoreductase [Xanthobacteraceae bacterium]
MDVPVIIVGAGPTGLTAALFLAGRGVPVVVLERHAEPFEDPRASTFHPPTLEMFAASGVTQRLHDLGIIAQRWQFWGRREGLVAEFDLSLLADVTPYPYRLQCEQHKLVRVLLDKLGGRPGFSIRFDAEVTSVEQDSDGVTVRTLDGDAFRAAFVIGADGGRSVVRKSQDIVFEGFTYPERFLVITNPYDFERQGYAYSSYVSDPNEWCALFKVPGKGPPGHWRVVFPTQPAEEERDLLDHGNAQRRLQGFIAADEPYDVMHTNLYTVHQRVAKTYRVGRVLLAGDAAHVNNPLGGMGMNFGIHDAVSVAQTLGRVLDGSAPETELDLYDRRRRTVANDFLQAMTIQNKRVIEERDERLRAERLTELHDTAADPDKARAYLLRTSMIEGLRAAAAVR